MIDSMIWEAIEDPFFGAEIGVVSTPRAFDAALSSHRNVLEFLSSITSAGDVQLVFDRLSTLLDDPADDPRYCHPHDLPIAVYLTVLEKVDLLAGARASRLAAKHENLWWSRAVSLRLLSHLGADVEVAYNVYRPDPSQLGDWRRDERSTVSLYPSIRRVSVKAEARAKYTICTDSRGAQSSVATSATAMIVSRRTDAA